MGVSLCLKILYFVQSSFFFLQYLEIPIILFDVNACKRLVMWTFVIVLAYALRVQIDWCLKLFNFGPKFLVCIPRHTHHLVSILMHIEWWRYGILVMFSSPSMLYKLIGVRKKSWFYSKVLFFFFFSDPSNLFPF